MDAEVMRSALSQVLGDGYEPPAVARESKSPSPHDFLQGRVSKDAGGVDMHVPGAPQPRLKPVKQPTQEKVAHGLLTAGAAGGILSMPTLVKETASKLSEANVKGAGKVAAGAEKVGRLVPKALKTPKAGAAIAGGAAALETAGLAGDFLGRKVTGSKVQKNAGHLVPISKAQEHQKHRVQGAAAIGAGAVVGGTGLAAGGVPGVKEPNGLNLWKLKGSGSPKSLLAPGNVGHNAKIVASQPRAGILGFRSNIHEAFLRYPGDESKKQAAAHGAGHPFGRGVLEGKYKAEKKIVRGMRLARLGSHGATAAGAAGVAYGARKIKGDVSKSDNRAEEISGGMLAGGATLAGVGHAGTKALNHFSRKYENSVKGHYREVQRLAPHFGGLYTKPAKVGMFKTKPARETMYPQKRGEQLARENFVGNIKGGAKVQREVGRHIGAAANERHFVEVFNSTSKVTRKLTRGPGIALAGAGATGLAVAHQKDKVHKADVREGEFVIAKADEDKRQVFGWCSISKKDGVDVVDLQGDIVPIEEIEKSAYDYMLRSRKGGNQHERRPAVTKNFGRDEHDEPVHVGDVIESMVFTPEKIEKMGLPESFPQGWWVGFKIHDDETWRQIKTGERAGFSIHGKGKREPVDSVSKATDRLERVKDATLGAAGATAAGLGLASMAVPKFAGRGVLRAVSAEKAENFAHRAKTASATIGSTAGVYGGIHAVNLARKGKKEVKTVVPVNSNQYSAPELPRGMVHKAWSPVVHNAPLESKRQGRAENYQRGLAAGSAAAGVGAVASLGGAARARKTSMQPLRNAEEVSAAIAQHHARAYAATTARVAAKPNKRGVNRIWESHLRNNQKAVEHLHALAGAHNEKVMNAAPKAAKLVRRSGRLAALSAGLGVGAEVVHRKRSGSWKPYGRD